MATPNDAASPTKKPQPIPWTHQETVHLIRAYQEKWYALKRGPLRHNQWEEVAVVVAARCGYDLAYPAKSALQCRHKMEKLRQRHRAEKKHVAATLRPAAWQYTALMEDLERGPLPISALAPFQNDTDSDPDDDGTYQNDNDADESFVKSKSINCILSERPVRMRTRERGFLREHVQEERYEDDNYDRDDDDDDDDVLALPAEIRAFAERIIGMESLKMEMMKETERCRLEMEKKRIQMILDSQRRIVDSIGRAFGSNKRIKITEQI